MKNNVKRITDSGSCTGCAACGVCEHITFQKNVQGFFAPVVDAGCTGCGTCVAACIYDALQDEDHGQNA